ncbi:uncharacterized protein LOC104890294 [Beta vulgaris subsp. vulgaris]|uniref:uncharacterized protein LOC104890294 n=1 Tax=Beta vulgaris subsp. vulgaris TaxID=3555 RepID=UPI00053FDDBB|nr:uncharacterized protein LOC104890294 [Beta vulgaris subsp. vulgaris]
MIKTAEGNWVSNKDDIHQEILNPFFRIYQGAHHDDNYWEELGSIQNLIPQITLEQQLNLVKPITLEEVKQVIFQMGSLKAPGPDGIPAMFYQKYWSIVGKDIWQAVSHFFSSGFLLKEWNYTNICLIPKKERPEEASQFRPISMCNVIYKAISKLISNRLKPILKSVVSPYQNAFVPGRLMSDNCLIAHELVSGIKQRTRGKQYYAALKIDMFKAYDKVDWNFLHWLLTQMKIPAICCHWIMQCVTTVSYSILINGEPSQRFNPTCGLRQGDPLSSYLFILVMEILSRFLTKASEEKIIQGIKLSRTGPSISHLFFADDALIFFKASPESCAGVKSILERFSRLSGEVINFNKSLIMFSPNTPIGSRQQMRGIVNTPDAESIGKYLGCNVEVNGRSSRQFLPLVEKVENRLSSWHHLSLSIAGRMLLINSVLSMLSLNILSVFLIPKTIADRLNSIFARFLWAGTREAKPIYWKSKDTLELPKGSGGLGIRNVHLFNKALLAKQATRIHNSPQLLISRVYCAKYKNTPVNMIMQKHKIGRVTWGFRGLCRSIKDCSQGFIKLIGDGATTNILEDKWLRGGSIKLKSGISLENLGLHQVRDLMCPENNSWNAQLIWRTFSPETSIRILSTYLPQESFQDQYAWSESKSGSVRVKDMYIHLLNQRGELKEGKNRTPFWSKLWASNLRPKWKIFVWRIINNAIATNYNLRKRNIPVSPTCYLCHQQEEDDKHLFRDCEISARVWLGSSLGIITSSSHIIPLADWICNFLRLFWKEDGINSGRATEFVVILWSIWIHRNDIAFKQINKDPSMIIHRKIALLKEWEESKNITATSRKSGDESREAQQDVPISHDANQQQDLCVVAVDGAWKCYKDKFPRAGIGWAARVNGLNVFEGNAIVVTSSSIQTEAYAVYRGILEAKMRGIQHIQIHTDSVEVIRAIDSQHQPFEIATLVHDIRALCRGFSYCRIKKTSRMEVTLAHSLAVAARQGKLIS